MLKKTIVFTTIIVLILVLAIVAVNNLKGILFHELPWLMPIALFLGIISGIFRGLLYIKATLKINHQTDRHTIDSFLEHWGTAASIIVLMVSAIFTKSWFRSNFLSEPSFHRFDHGLVFWHLFSYRFFSNQKIQKLDT